jgi:hypothetical protein
MKKIFSLVIVILTLGFLTHSILKGQTRKIDKEVLVVLTKKEIKVEQINKTKREVGYFTVEDLEGKFYTLKVNDDTYTKYSVQSNVDLVIEKDIFDTETHEIKEDYDNRQIDINSSANIWIGRILLIILALSWIKVIWNLINSIHLIIRTLKSKRQNRKTTRFTNSSNRQFYYFKKLKKIKFEKFEIHLGYDKHTQYYYDDISKDNYKEIVEIKDYEKLGLIDSITLDIKEILVDTKWESFEQLIQEKNNSKELFDMINELTSYYLENTLHDNENGSFEIVDYSITYLIDGEKRKVIDFNEKRREIYLNILIYLSVFFVVSGALLCFKDILLGIIVLFIPCIFYWIWVSHNGLLELRNVLKYSRDGKNILFFYLIELPFKIVISLVYLILISGWYLIPAYFILESGIYYSFLEILGGYIGICIWAIIYILIMSFVGEKLYNHVYTIEKKIKSLF